MSDDPLIEFQIDHLPKRLREIAMPFKREASRIVFGEADTQARAEKVKAIAARKDEAVLAAARERE